MNFIAAFLLGAVLAMGSAGAEVSIDQEALGKKFGGWQKRSKQYAQYDVSGVTYRTYRPECTPTPDGGLYVSLRIDHLRGFFSSDDHAVLEITIDRRGHISTAKSSIAIQGRSVSSDVIEGVNKAGNATSGIDKAVQIGTDLVSDLTTKLLRTKLIEPGRVAFPSAVRHNYNLLYQTIRWNGRPVVDVPLKADSVQKEDVVAEDTGRPSPPLTIEGYRSPPTTIEVTKPQQD